MDIEKEKTANGIVMPSDFPMEKYNEIQHYLVKYGSSKKVEWMLFVTSWNGVGYRFRAMAEHDEKFTLSITKPKPHFHEDLYIQANEFFSFFYCGVSTLDCLFFSIYCIGSLIDIVAFPVMDAKNLKFRRFTVKDQFNTTFTGDPLSVSLTNIICDPVCKRLYDYRDVLSHRGILNRNIDTYDDKITIPINPKESSDNWVYHFPMDKNTTSSYRQWLSKELVSLLNGIEIFCKIRL
jgi:hypothetical protein